MKKGLKKILAATTALALLLSMGTAAMAAEYSTVTTYTEDGVSVVTTVTGATAEKEYTYLVSKTGTVAQDSDIVYIDQKKATSTSVTFDFVTDVDNLNVSDNVYTADVKVGTDSGVAFDNANNTITLVNKTVTYSAENGYVYVDEDAAEALNAGSTSTFDATITFHLIPAPGYTTVGMTVNGDAVELIDDTYTATSGADVATYTFVFAPVTPAASVEVSTIEVTGTKADAEASVTFTPNAYTETETTRQLTYFGKAVGGATEFGILVSESTFSLDDDNNKIVGTDVMKYAAAGKGSDNTFAISLYETKAAEEEFTKLTADTLYVAVYAKGADGKWFITTVEPKAIPAAQE